MSAVTAFHAGPWVQLQSHVFGKPPLHKQGKLFVADRLGATGTEISLNRLEAGDGYPFLHRHHAHEEVYLVIDGRGEILVDGRSIPVAAGSVVRIAPEGVRSIRAATDSPLTYACIQAVAGSLISRTVEDGELVPGPVVWGA